MAKGEIERGLIAAGIRWLEHTDSQAVIVCCEYFKVRRWLFENFSMRKNKMDI